MSNLYSYFDGLFTFFPECCSLFCLNEEDSRWQPMCTNQLTKGGNLDKLLGMEECKSPFGIYELKIPKDDNLACDDNRITNTNCQDLDVSFTDLLESDDENLFPFAKYFPPVS